MEMIRTSKCSLNLHHKRPAWSMACQRGSKLNFKVNFNWLMECVGSCSKFELKTGP